MNQTVGETLPSSPPVSSLRGVSKVRPPEEGEHPLSDGPPSSPFPAGQQRQQHEPAGLDGRAQRSELQHRLRAGIRADAPPAVPFCCI